MTRILVQHIFQHHLARKRGFPHEGEGEERGKCHDPDTADLYQNQDDNMSDMRETGGYVDGG